MTVDPPGSPLRAAGLPTEPEPWSARRSAYRSRSAPRFVFAGHRAAWLSDSSCTSSFPKARRAVSEPPPGALQLGKETDEGHGPERFFYDKRSYTGVCRPRPASAGRRADSPGAGRAVAGASAAPAELRDLLRPGLRSGSTFLAQKVERGQRNVPSQAEAHIHPGRQTQTDRGPEKHFYNTAGYTGTCRHGGPSVVEVGPLSELRVVGFTGKTAAVANGSYRRRGDLGGRPTFEKVGSGMFVYSTGRRWCISLHACDPNEAVLAYADSLAQSPPNGEWQLNPQCAAGSPAVTSDARCAELSDITRPNLRSGARAQMPCPPSMRRARPQSAPYAPQRHYESSTSTSSRRKSTRDDVGLALRPGLSSGGTYMSSLSGAVASPTHRRFRTPQVPPRSAQSSPTSPKQAGDAAPGAGVQQGRGALAGRRRGRYRDAAKGSSGAPCVGAGVASAQHQRLEEDSLSLALRQLGLDAPMMVVRFQEDIDETSLVQSPGGSSGGDAHCVAEDHAGRASGFSLKLSTARARSLRVV